MSELGSMNLQAYAIPSILHKLANCILVFSKLLYFPVFINSFLNNEEVYLVKSFSTSVFISVYDRLGNLSHSSRGWEVPEHGIG